MASAYLNLLQDLQEKACTGCGGSGKQPAAPQLNCERCYGIGIRDPFEQDTRFYRNRSVDIVSRMLDNPDDAGIYPTGRAYLELDALIDELIAMTVGYTWTAACQLHAQGLDPNRHNIPDLVSSAFRDLNPKESER